MKLMTDSIGEIEYSEENVIKFADGIPGFEECKDFVLVLSEYPELPFHYLQSVERADVVLVVTNPFLFVDNYDFNIEDEIVEDLEIETPQDLLVYSVVTIPKKVKYATINLTAPIIVNIKNNRGRQIVLEEIDDIRHSLFEKKQ